MGNRKWGHIEDAILRVWCNQESCEQLAERLDRTVGGVKSRLRTLGIKKKNIYPNRTWTLEMEGILRRRAGNQSTKSIAKLLGVSIYSVKLKSSRMGISLRTRKNRLWTLAEMERLEDSLVFAKSWSDVSKKVGRSEGVCRKKAGELGLTLNLKREWTTRELKQLHEYRLNGMSYNQIAEMFGRSETSVRKRYARYKKEANIS